MVQVSRGVGVRRKETVEEFLARGGKVRSIPYGRTRTISGNVDNQIGVKDEFYRYSNKGLRNVRVNRQRSRRGLYK